MKTLRGMQSAMWFAPVGWLLAACAGSPSAAPAGGAAPAAEAPAEAPKAAELGPGEVDEPSLEPREPFPVDALPEPGLELRPSASRQGLDVHHYTLDIDLRGLADSVFTARAELSLSLAPGTEHIDLDFVGLRADSVRIGGERVSFSVGPDLLRVVPAGATGDGAGGAARAEAAGEAGRADEAGEADRADGAADADGAGEASGAATAERVRLEVFYGGTPRDGLFIGPDPAGEPTAFADNWPNRARWWFPANDHPPDKATAEFRVRAPAGYAVVANGRLVGSEGGTWHWRTDVEIPAYTMVIGVAEFERAELGPAACGAAPHAAGGECVDVSVWALTGSGDYGRRRFSRAPDMLDFYAEMFAPFPYEKLAHVQSSTRFGGMENSSAIFYAMGGWAEEDMGEGVIAHETVHQWFGDSVTPESWAHLWVSEGFATYFAAVYFGERDGPAAFREAMESGRRRILDSDASDRPVVDERPDLFGLLNSNSYPKGAWILHMLRSMLGDEAFFAGIRAYYAANAGGAADTDDVRRAMEAASGESLAWFFDQWAYAPGFPRLEVATRSSSDATILTIEQVQDADWPTFRLPLEIELRAPDGTAERREIWMEGRREMLRLPPGLERDDITIDPDGTLLLEVVTGS